MGDDWGDLDDLEDKKKKKNEVALGNPERSSAEEEKDTSEKKRQNLFFGAADGDDLAELDDLPDLGSNFPEQNEDKFNKVLSSSKEGGGLLASIGLSKAQVRDESMDEDLEEGDPHKQSALFDRIAANKRQKAAQ